jgi:lactate oxidase
MATSSDKAAPAAATNAPPTATPAEMNPYAGPHAEYTGGYSAGTAVRKLQLTDLIAIADEAAKVIPAVGFDYITDGAGSEWTLQANRTAFDRYQIVPRMLTGVAKPDLRTQLLGIDLAMPITVTQMAAHGLAHFSAEAGSAQGAAAAGTIFTPSTVSTLSLEQIASSSPGPKFFGLYPMSDRGFTRELLQRAKEAGYRAIVMTVDTTATGNRESGVRDHFTFHSQTGNMPNGGKDSGLASQNGLLATKLDGSDVAFAIQESGLPVIVKGIMHPQDALRAIDAGAAAIQVSNHGGRQLDSVPASFTALPAIAAAVERRVPIMFDSGIRRGQDVFKALALGADVVCLGRPVLYGLALGGWMGVQSVLELLSQELSMVMQLAGTQTVEDIKRTQLVS